MLPRHMHGNCKEFGGAGSGRRLSEAHLREDGLDAVSWFRTCRGTFVSYAYRYFELNFKLSEMRVESFDMLSMYVTVSFIHPPRGEEVCAPPVASRDKLHELQSLVLPVGGWAWSYRLHSGKIYCYETTEEAKNHTGP